MNDGAVPGSRSPTRVTGLALCSMAALVWALAARALGPSDIWDQTQPKTIAYTTDMLVHGGSHWILPIERGEYPATKPPLYNWLAAPFVRWLGFNSDLAHKFPSVIALCVCWLVIVRIGRRLDADASQNVGWLAGMALVSNYTFFKLGYLARPDMLLTLWLLLAWMIATDAFSQHRRRGVTSNPAVPRPWLVASFWLCIALAALTKGPAAIVGVLYAIIAARVIGGSWRSFKLLHPMAGLGCCALIVGAWIFSVWRIDPDHLQQTLWYSEIAGRVTGIGPEGSKEGLYGWLRTSLHQLIYFVVRFLPWSVAAILMIIGLFENSRKSAAASNSEKTLPDSVAADWLRGGAIWVGIVIALFTLSASKRADYIAAAFGPGALLAGWWLLRWPPCIGRRWPWLAPAAAFISLIAMTSVNNIQPAAPVPQYGSQVRQFISEVAAHLEREPLPVAFYNTGDGPMQALLGFSVKEGADLVLDTARIHQRFWLIAGEPDATATDTRSSAGDVRSLLPEVDGTLWIIERQVESPVLPWRHRKPPERMTLHRVQAAAP